MTTERAVTVDRTRFARFSAEPAAVFPPGYTAPLEIVTTRELRARAAAARDRNTDTRW